MLEKLLKLEPSARAPLVDVARHAWLVGGLDTQELVHSFSGLQREQETTQRQLARVQAELRTMEKLEQEEGERRVRVEEEKKKRLDAEQRRRRSVLNGV